MADETRIEDDSWNINKKYTFFIIDGSEEMFDSEGSGENDFKAALRLVMGEMLSICCQKSLNNQIGIIVTNTKSSNDEGLKNCALLMRMGIPGQEEVNEIKDLMESDNIKTAFLKYSEGFNLTDLSQVLNFCKSQFKSFSNTRHQAVIYLTNNRNPFGRSDFWESEFFKRTKTAVMKIIGHGHRKTLGEFSVILLPEDCEKPDSDEEKKKEPWFNLDSEVFTEECDASRRIRQKTTATRSHANVTLNLGPGVSFDVGVYTLVSEMQPLKSSQKFSKESEMPIENRVGYIAVGGANEPSTSTAEPKNKKAGVPEDDQASASEIGDVFDGQSSPLPKDPTLAEIKEKLLGEVIHGGTMKSKSELKMSVSLGGEKIFITKKEKDAASTFTDKGISLVGFCPIDSIDTELSVVQPKFLRPNEDTTLGSTRIYRALLDRCVERKQAMICRYQTRSNEKLRIVALIPFKRAKLGEMEDEKKPKLSEMQRVKAEADASEFLHEGFHVVSLPFREELKDDSGRFMDPPVQGWPTVEDTEKEVAKNFIKKLTMSYNPSFYENPRLLSQRAALCERATGEELIERKDTLAPYHAFPDRLARMQTELNSLTQTFDLSELGKPDVKPVGRKRKNEREDEMDTGDVMKKRSSNMNGNLRGMYESGKLAKLTKDVLFEMIKENCPQVSCQKSMKKQDLIDILKQHVEMMDYM